MTKLTGPAARLLTELRRLAGGRTGSAQVGKPALSIAVGVNQTGIEKAIVTLVREGFIEVEIDDGSSKVGNTYTLIERDEDEVNREQMRFRARRAVLQRAAEVVDADRKGDPMEGPLDRLGQAVDAWDQFR